MSNQPTPTPAEQPVGLRRLVRHRVALFLASPNPAPDRTKVVTPQGTVFYIRTEDFEVEDVGDAMMASDPRPDEIVLN